MIAFEAYNIYNGLKLHFSSEQYDFFKYGGKVKITPAGFERRKDKFWYEKLAKKPDLINYIVANLIDGDRAKWIGGLLTDTECERIYIAWCKRQQSITYHIENQITILQPKFDDNFKVIESYHPFILMRFLGNELSYETLIILNDLCNFFSDWDTKLKDDVIWPTVRLRCYKYRPFISYDKEKIRKVLLTYFKK